MKRVLPPVFLLLCVILMIISKFWFPLAKLVNWPFNLIGVVFVLGGVCIAFSGARQFKVASTNIHTFKDPDKLVMHGLFNYSRNPMYLGFAVTALGSAILVGSASGFLIAVVHFLFLDRYYIPFEENRMSALFGADYQDYKKRVRRWI